MKKNLLKIWNFIKIFYGISFCISGFAILVIPFVEEDFPLIRGIVTGLILFLLSFLCLKKKKNNNNDEEQEVNVESIEKEQDVKVLEINDKKYCPICKQKYGIISKTKVIDGFVCGYCASITSSYTTRRKSELQEYWNKNNELVKIFKPTQVIKSFGNEQINIDYDNKLFVYGNLTKITNPKIYAFNEVVGFEYKVVNQKTTIEKKGGITRAVVGNMIAGPVGAIVGSNTAKQNVKIEETKLFYIYLNNFAGNNTIIMSYPPSGLESFLNDCISIGQKKENSDETVNDLMKFKQLLDNGIISQEEFDKKKKELLSL